MASSSISTMDELTSSAAATAVGRGKKSKALLLHSQSQCQSSDDSLVSINISQKLENSLQQRKSPSSNFETCPSCCTSMSRSSSGSSASGTEIGDSKASEDSGSSRSASQSQSSKGESTEEVVGNKDSEQTSFNVETTFEEKSFQETD